MLARYYEAGLGRFLSVDPARDTQKNLYEPQRWNRYAYVVNNPLRYNDPDGLEYVDDKGKKLKEKVEKKGNEKQKKDVKDADASPIKIKTDDSTYAAFGHVDPTTHEVDPSTVKTYDTGTQEGKSQAAKEASDIETGKATDPNRKTLTGTNDKNADGSVSITIYRGSKQYSNASDQQMSMGNYVMTVFAHESAEAIGKTHQEAAQHETP